MILAAMPLAVSLSDPLVFLKNIVTDRWPRGWLLSLLLGSCGQAWALFRLNHIIGVLEGRRT